MRAGGGLLQPRVSCGRACPTTRRSRRRSSAGFESGGRHPSACLAGTRIAANPASAPAAVFQGFSTSAAVLPERGSRIMTTDDNPLIGRFDHNLKDGLGQVHSSGPHMRKPRGRWLRLWAGYPGSRSVDVMNPQAGATRVVSAATPTGARYPAGWCPAVRQLAGTSAACGNLPAAVAPS